MASIKSRALVMGIIIFMLLLAGAAIELTIGLSLTRGLHNRTIGEMYLLADEKKLYLSIDLEPPAGRIKAIRAPLAEITFAVDPALTTDIILNSTDNYIWGYRWPWVDKVTITLKSQRQKDGFDSLFADHKREQLHRDLAKGDTVGVTHFGFLTSGGRILE